MENNLSQSLDNLAPLCYNNNRINKEVSRMIQKESKKEIRMGDIVKVRTWGSMKEEYGLDEDGDIPVNPDTAFVAKMKPLCGLTAEVVVISYNEGERVFQLLFSEEVESEHDTRWWFTKEMFE